MDIVPGTDDSLSSKASKKSTRDWEKTKEHAIRWAFSTGKAAWTFGTTFLVLVVPLIVELHREEQMMEMEKELNLERKNTEKAFQEFLPKSIICHLKEKKVKITIKLNILKFFYH